MNRVLLIASLVLPFPAIAQIPDAINLAVPWITTGPNTLRLTGGFSGDAGSFLRLTDSIENLMGRGETSYVSAEVGMRLRRIDLGIHGHAAARRRVELGIDVYGQSFRYNQLVESSILAFNRNIGVFDSLNELYPDAPINYVRSSYGAKVFAEIPLAPGRSRVSFVYDYDVSAYRPITNGTAAWFGQLNFRGPEASGSLTGIQTGRLTASYLYNTVDNPVQPKQGAMLRVAGGLAGLGGNVNFFEADIDARYYHRGFARRHVVALHVRGRLIAGYDGKAAPPVDRYYMGGEDELRGFDSWSVGPIGFVPGVKSVYQLNSDGSVRTQTIVVNNVRVTVPLTIAVPYYGYTSICGDTKVVGNAEYRIPLFGPVTLVLFDDVGINRTTFVHQLRLNNEALIASFPTFGGSASQAIIARGLQDPRMSLGAELNVLVPKVRIPVRFYWAWNPLAYRDYLPLPPLALDPNMFPDSATLLEALDQTARAPYYREPRSRLQFSIGRTF